MDSCSTDSCTNNEAFLVNLLVCKEEDKLLLCTNGGDIEFKQKGIFKLLPAEMYFNPASLATVLSMKDALNIPGVVIEYDLTKKQLFVLTYRDNIFEFQECKEGLYFYKYNSNDKIKTTVKDYLFVQSVEDNKKDYSMKDIQKADTITKYQEYLFWTSSEDLGLNLNHGLIKNA